MKKDLRKIGNEFKNEVYDMLREKIKAMIGDESLDNKDCIEKIWEALAFLSVCSE